MSATLDQMIGFAEIGFGVVGILFGLMLLHRAMRSLSSRVDEVVRREIDERMDEI